jgi:RNA polymerase sigma-70 factor (ECF subfamily)
MTDESYEDLRPLLFSIAYRMLGSVSEAEDIVQEAFLRFHTATNEGEDVESEKAFLSTVTTRLAIDHLRSARVRRESYVGEWLPEPLVIDERSDTARDAEMADSLSMTFLLMLETLSPVERAVFLLHDVFDYGYGEIAEMVSKSEVNTRQIATRARQHVRSGKHRFDASREEGDELARRFLAALQDGDVDGLLELLAADAALYGDGGGIAAASPKPVIGGERVARFLGGIFSRAHELQVTLRFAIVNGQPGGLSYDADGRVINAFAFDVAGAQIQTVRSVVNPEKLVHLGPVSDMARISRPRT